MSVSSRTVINSLLWFLLIAPCVSLADDTVGFIEGALSVNEMGAATYSIPVELPPGINGMQPGLSFAYNSQGGSGDLGVGWNISGLSVMHRCPATLDDDGFIDGIDYDDNDRFCLDGDRLVLTAGVHGRAGSEYITESNGNLRIIARGQVSGENGGYSPRYWEVISSDGKTRFYGHSPSISSNNSAYDPSSLGVYAWNIAEEYDQFGNGILYSYFKDTSMGIHRIDSIEYGANRIEFDWVDRVDTLRGSLAKYTPFLKDSVLNKVTLSRSNRELSSFGFKYRVVNSRSVLDSVEKCSAISQLCLPEKRFEMRSGSNHFEFDSGASASLPNAYFSGSGYSMGTQLVDIDGDGLLDLIQLYHPTNGDYGNSAQRHVFLNTGNGFDRDAGYSSTLPNIFFSGSTTEMGTRWSDVDGDGLVDLIQLYHPTNGDYNNVAQRHVFLNTGSGFERDAEFSRSLPNVFFSGSGYDMGTQLSDVDGDGLIDLIQLYHPTNGDYYNIPQRHVYLNTGSGFKRNVSYSNSLANVFFSGSTTDMGTRLSDVNGDGLVDLIQLYHPTNGDYGNIAQRHVYLNTGTNFKRNSKYSASLPNIHFSGSGYDMGTRLADVNGDGYIDLIQLYHPTNGDYGYVAQRHVFLNDGATFKRSSSYSNSLPNIHFVGSTTDMGTRLADINGDGLVDLIQLYHPSNGDYNNNDQRHLYLNTGEGFERDTSYSNSLPNAFFTGSGYGMGTRLADIDGDGLVDLLQLYYPTNENYSNVKQRRIFLNKQKASILSAVTSAGIKKHKIKYKSLAHTNHFDQSESASGYPEVGMTTTAMVVSELGNFAGGDDFNRVNYSYSGLKYHVRKLQSLGFRQIKSTDQVTGIRTVTTYSQDWEKRTSGMVESSRTIASNGVVLTESVNQLENLFHGVHDDRYMPYIKATTSVQRDLDGRVINTTTLEHNLQKSDGWVSKDVSCVAPSDLFNGAIVPCNSSAMMNDREIYKITDYQYLSKSESGKFAPLLDRKTTTIKLPKAPPFQNATERRVVKYKYDLSTGQIESETLEPENDKKWLTKSYTYHSSGQIETTTVSGADIKPRTSTVFYNPTTKLPIKKKNALGHTQVLKYGDARFPWLPTKVIAPDGSWVITKYDSWGGVRRTEKGHGSNRFSWSETKSIWCDNSQRCSGDPSELFFVKSSASLGQPSFAFFDSLGREVRSLSYGLKNGDAAPIHRSTKYNKRGLVQWAGQPSFDQYSTLGSTTKYDELGRVLSVVHADYTTTKTRYSGRKVVHTDEKGNTKTIIKNALGQQIQARDTRGNPISYEYDAFGNMVLMDDSQGNITRIGYDIRGFKTRMDDPDLGLWTYRYNVLGELVEQTDANKQTTRITYDLLGRMTSRTDHHGTAKAQTSNWHYDNASQSPVALGKLWKVTNNGNYLQVMSYNSYGWHNKTTTTIDNQRYVSRNTYDGYGRVVNTIYPTGYSVQNRYHSQLGTLHSIHQVGSNGNLPIWQAINANARGQVEQEKLGKYIHRTQNHNEISGLVENIYSSNSTSGLEYQSLAYQWDEVGNLERFADELPGVNVSETYRYDDLYRLEDVVTAHGTLSTRYDDLGNIVSKSGVGSYSYNNGSVPSQCGALNHAAGPHAVRSILGNQSNYFCYDANGNVIKDKTRSLTYTGFNKPNKIVRGNTVVKFEYGPDRNRFKRVENKGSSTTTTHYVGGYEKIIAGGKTKHRITIAGVALVIQDGGLTNVNFLLKDHLGSITSIVNQSGILAETMSFDAWGNRRLTDGMLKSSPSNFTNRGYTGHEHVDSVGLIHMNGRVYDPVIGRFLSADPIVQAPNNLQNLNRYSYVLNNPLSMTDPSGYNWVKKQWKQIRRAAAAAVGAVVGGIVGAVAGCVTGFASGGGPLGCIGGGVAGFYVGMAVGASMGYSYRYGKDKGLKHHDALDLSAKSGVSSFVTAGIFYGVGSGLDWLKATVGYGGVANGIVRVATHGFVNGALAHAQGGHFGHAAFVGGAMMGLRYKGYHFFKFTDNAPLASIEQAVYSAALAKSVGESGPNFTLVLTNSLMAYWFNDGAHPAQKGRSECTGRPCVNRSQGEGGFAEDLANSAKENLKFGTTAKAVVGSGVGTSSIFTVDGIAEGDSALTLDYARGAIVEAGVFIRGDVYSSGRIDGFYQSGEICMIGCIRGAWDYQGNFNIGTRIVFPFSFGGAIGGGYTTTGRKLLDNVTGR